MLHRQTAAKFYRTSAVEYPFGVVEDYQWQAAVPSVRVGYASIARATGGTVAVTQLLSAGRVVGPAGVAPARELVALTATAVRAQCANRLNDTHLRRPTTKKDRSRNYAMAHISETIEIDGTKVEVAIGTDRKSVV